MLPGSQLEQHLRDTNRASQGVRNVPDRLRIQISRRRNDDEDAKVTQPSQPEGDCCLCRLMRLRV